jgi:predicted aldo/keto reductase-like oxidoreductase
MVKLVYGTGRLCELKSITQVSSLLQFLTSSGISEFDTAPTYGFGYTEKYLGQYLPSSKQIISKLPLTTVPRTSFPLELFPRIHWLLNRRVLRRFLEKTVWDARDASTHKCDNTENFELFFQKTIIDCRLNKINTYLIHGDDFNCVNQNLIDFISFKKAYGSITNIGYSFNAQELSAASIDTFIKNHIWIDALQISVNSYSGTLPDLIGLLKANSQTQFYLRGIFSRGKDHGLATLRKINRSDLNNLKVIVESLSKQNISQALRETC